MREQLLPSPSATQTDLVWGCACLSAGPGAPEVAAPGREDRAEDRALPSAKGASPGGAVLAAPEAESPSSELGTQRPPFSAGTLLTTSLGRAGSGTWPFLTSQANRAAGRLHFPSPAPTALLTVPVSARWRTAQPGPDARSPRRGARRPPSPVSACPEPRQTLPLALKPRKALPEPAPHVENKLTWWLSPWQFLCTPSEEHKPVPRL